VPAFDEWPVTAQHRRCGAFRRRSLHRTHSCRSTCVAGTAHFADQALRVVVPLDDLYAQQRRLCHHSVNLPGVVTTTGRDQVEPREATAYLVENQTGPVAVLNRGEVDNDLHRQPLGVDPGVDLAALDLLAGAVTHLVVVTAPFSADLIGLLSRTAAEGLASPSIRSRNAICSSAQIASQTPSRWNLRKIL
jgi:hypothetical protein